MQFKSAPVASEMTEVTGERSYRPQWMTEWIANKSKYVLLQCGHKETLASADKTICLIQTFEYLEVLCIKCNAFSPILQSLTICEYLNIPMLDDSLLF